MNYVIQELDRMFERRRPLRSRVIWRGEPPGRAGRAAAPEEPPPCPFQVTLNVPVIVGCTVQ